MTSSIKEVGLKFISCKTPQIKPVFSQQLSLLAGVCPFTKVFTMFFLWPLTSNLGCKMVNKKSLFKGWSKRDIQYVVTYMTEVGFLKKMELHFLTIGILLSLHISTLPPTSSAEREKRQLPCTHPLRISYPQLFTHCGQLQPCTYTSWSSWQMVPNSVVSVPTSQCPSGRSFREERTRTALGSGCTGPLSQTQNICEFVVAFN